MKAIRILMTVLFLFLVSSTTGCAPQRDPNTAAVSQGAALVFSSSLAALEVLDELHAQRMRAIENPTAEQVKWATEHSQRLHRLRDVLAVWRRWLTGEISENQGMQAARDVAATLQLIADDLRAQGVKIPAAVSTGLAALQGFV